MKIYNSAGVVLLDIEVGDDSYSYREIMGRDDLTLYFALTSFVEILVGAYCVFQNVTYYLLKPESLKLQHTRNWEYTLTMEIFNGKYYTQGGVLYKCFDTVSYYSFFTEKWADRLGGVKR